MDSTSKLTPKYSFTSPRRQLFCFPHDVIASMLNNPSSAKGLMKLYQTCKYFYSKRPIIVADKVVIQISYEEENLSRIEIYERDVTHLHDQIWLTGDVWFHYYEAAVQLPKFYRYSPTALHMHKSTISYKDFLTVTSEKTVTVFELGRSSYINSSVDPNLLEEPSMDVILSNLPNIRRFWYNPGEDFTLGLMTKLNELKFNNKFGYFCTDITSVAEDFDVNLLCSFIKKNTTPQADVHMLCYEGAAKQMKKCLKKLEPKWKAGAHRGLKKLFKEVDPNWNKKSEH